MTQEDKKLLLKDLCSRLPYGVKISVQSWDEREMEYVDRIDVLYSVNGDEYIKSVNEDYDFSLEDIKPYLFPLSSMTDELWDKEFRGYSITEFTRDSFKYGCETLEFYDYNPDLSSMVGFINQLIKNHFDIYGLISKGLAIDATELNIY